MKTSSHKSGQALIEFVVGLVAILVVFAVLIQIGRIAKEHTQALLGARERAGEFALSEEHTTLMPGPMYIQDWSEGGDGTRYSRDDRIRGGDAEAVPDHVAVHARPEELASWVGENDLTELYRTELPVGSFGLVHGRYESDPIELYSVIRNLIYDADSISVDADVYMVWTRGLY